MITLHNLTSQIRWSLCCWLDFFPLAAPPALRRPGPARAARLDKRSGGLELTENIINELIISLKTTGGRWLLDHPDVFVTTRV